MDNLNRKKRSGNITNEQRTLLIEFMNKHSELLKGKLTSSFTLKDYTRLWSETTEILNSVNGAEKDWKSWRKCWHDFQSRSKKKHTLLKHSMAATGGGKPNTETLTLQEEQVLNIKCSTSVNGHPDIGESDINLFEDLEDEMRVEYLQEYEKDVFPTSTHSNNNNSNMLFPKKIKTVIDNSNELPNTKENEIRSSDIHVKKVPSKVNKVLQDIRISLNENSNEHEKSPIEKKKMSTKELRNTIEVSRKLNDVYEKTYELKKKYYEEKLEYLRRSAEAKERIADTMEKCNMFQ